VKAISLHQPWASLIARGRKTIETRRWPTRYRGDLLIVSTRQPIIRDLPAGKALCIVDLYACERMTVMHEPDACCAWYPDAYAWLLRNIRPIEPFAVKGSQGFYDIELPQAAAASPDTTMFSNQQRSFVNSQS